VLVEVAARHSKARPKPQAIEAALKEFKRRRLFEGMIAGV
jgi:hypothetical protein